MGYRIAKITKQKTNVNPKIIAIMDKIVTKSVHLYGSLVSWLQTQKFSQKLQMICYRTKHMKLERETWINDKLKRTNLFLMKTKAHLLVVI